MSFSAGSILGRLGLDVSDYAQGMLQANSIASVFPSVVTSFLANPLLGVANIAGTVASALGSALKAGLGQGIQLAADYEQATVALGTMLGSAEKAKVLLKDLSDFAAATPFEFPELQGATRSLVAFGVAQEEVIPTLRRIGDVAAGINQPIGQIAEIYGKARVQGRLFMEDINQLTGRGIPIIQELAKQFGVSESAVRKLVETGKVDFGNLEKAFESLTGEGGKFSGLMEAQSKTLGGVFSTLKDTIGLNLRDIAQSLIEGLNIKDVITQVSDVIASFKPLVLSAGKVIVDFWKERMAAGLPLLKGLWELLKGVGLVIGSVLVPAFKILIPIMDVLHRVLGFILEVVGKVLQGIGAIVNGVANIFGAGFSGLPTGSGSEAAGGAQASAGGRGGGRGDVVIENLNVPAFDVADASTKVAGKILPELRAVAELQHREFDGAVGAALRRGNA